MTGKHIAAIIITPLIVLSFIDGILILVGIQAHRQVAHRRKQYRDGLSIREYGYHYREP